VVVRRCGLVLGGALFAFDTAKEKKK